jgi:hypothetical protein
VLASRAGRPTPHHRLMLKLRFSNRRVVVSFYLLTSLRTDSEATQRLLRKHRRLGGV